MRVVIIREHPLKACLSLSTFELGGNWERRFPHAIPAHGIDLLGGPVQHINVLDLFRVQGDLTGLV